MLKKYSKEYKTESLELVKKIGLSKTAKKLGIPKGTLGTWVQKDKKRKEMNFLPKSELVLIQKIKKLEEEIKFKNKEIIREKEEKDILVKAMRFFAKSQ